MYDERLTFESINSGAQVLLSDGSVWRVALADFKLARSWNQGELIALAKSQSLTHPYLLTNVGRAECVLVVPSSGQI